MKTAMTTLKRYKAPLFTAGLLVAAALVFGASWASRLMG